MTSTGTVASMDIKCKQRLFSKVIFISAVEIPSNPFQEHALIDLSGKTLRVRDVFFLNKYLFNRSHRAVVFFQNERDC